MYDEFIFKAQAQFFLGKGLPPKVKSLTIIHMEAVKQEEDGNEDEEESDAGDSQQEVVKNH